MCAICGSFNPAGLQEASVQAVVQMREAMTHRGPDDAGLYQDTHAVLGVRRLSIIDIPGGHQPISNETKTVWVVLNGEIYNYCELREELLATGHRFTSRSDTEVLVHLYEEYAEGFLERLRGMFAIALWDHSKKKLLLARDRLGIKPLYYTFQGSTLLFSSELKGLFRHPNVAARLDLVALDQYLELDYVPAPRSILEGILKLPPGHFLVADQHQNSVKPFWRLPKNGVKKRLHVQEAVEHLGELTTESIRLHLRSDVPVGILLSGGLDSSLIAAFAAQEQGQLAAAFTIGFQEPSFDETAHAAQVASFLGLRHVVQKILPSDILNALPAIVEKCDEPLGDSSILPTWFLSQLARTEVPVALSGDGGDELFGGYPTYPAHRVAEWYRRLPGPLRDKTVIPMVRSLPVSHRNFSFDFIAHRFVRGASFPFVDRHRAWMGSLNLSERKQLWLPELWEQIRLQSEDPFQRFQESNFLSQSRDPAEAAMRIDLESYLPDDLLVKLDRMSMAHSLEVRVPLLDHPIVEFALHLPVSMKIRGFQTKVILRRLLQDKLPVEILRRPKKGFGMPVAAWLCTELRPLASQTLAVDSLARRGLWNPAFVQRLLQEHWQRKVNHGKLLWTLLTFELWMEAHVEHATVC